MKKRNQFIFAFKKKKTENMPHTPDDEKYVLKELISWTEHLRTTYKKMEKEVEDLKKQINDLKRENGSDEELETQ